MTGDSVRLATATLLDDFLERITRHRLIEHRLFVFHLSSHFAQHCDAALLCRECEIFSLETD